MSGHENLRKLVEAGASDDEIIAVARPLALDGKSVERVVIEVCDGPPRILKRQLIRWYRKAAETDQVWALWEAGSRWHLGGSHGPRPGKRDSLSTRGYDSIDGVPDEEIVYEDEAQAWVIRAAELGMRRAALEAARWHPDDPRALEWLELAYGDGSVDDDLDAANLMASAFERARHLDSAGDPDAGRWYRRAVEGPPWEVFDLIEASWPEAVGSFAIWAHGQGDESLCAAWSYRLLENAANHGMHDRGLMESEYKTYRISYQLARGAESARVQIMRHLLTEHALPQHERFEVALLLANSRWLGDEDVEVITAAIGRHATSMSLTSLLPPGTDQQPARDAPLTPRQVWALTHWVLADAVPACFRFAGLSDEADQLTRLVPPLPAHKTAWDLRRQFEAFPGWGALEAHDGGCEVTWPGSQTFPEASKGYVGMVLNAAGLAGQCSPFQTDRGAGDEDRVYRDGDGSWRLLRGRRLWLGLYLTTAVDGRATDWVATWDTANLFLARALHGALDQVAAQVGANLTKGLGNSELRTRWVTLTDAFALSIREFVDASPVLS